MTNKFAAAMLIWISAATSFGRVPVPPAAITVLLLPF
jgi:hypothetical protein